MPIGEGLWSLESSILQKLAVRKHFPSIGFEFVSEGFESLSTIFTSSLLSRLSRIEINFEVVNELGMMWNRLS